MEDARRIAGGEDPDHRGAIRLDELAGRERHGLGLENQKARAAGTEAGMTAGGTAVVLMGAVIGASVSRR